MKLNAQYIRKNKETLDIVIVQVISSANTDWSGSEPEVYSEEYAVAYPVDGDRRLGLYPLKDCRVDEGLNQ